MKTFEIHITGEQGINEEFTAMNLKNIVVELLHPDYSVLRTEFMSSFVKKFNSPSECNIYVQSIVQQLKSKVIRVKIESPFYEDYIEHSLYIESHFQPLDEIYPLSKNKRSGKIMATDREYNKSKYFEFLKKWESEDVELCLIDSFISEDFDWFKLYK